MLTEGSGRTEAMGPIETSLRQYLDSGREVHFCPMLFGLSDEAFTYVLSFAHDMSPPGLETSELYYHDAYTEALVMAKALGL